MAGSVMERCELLSKLSEEPHVLTRPYGSRAMGEANEAVARWMREAGMNVRQDAVGNLIGRYEGAGGGTFVLGSHLDTVRAAGKYDGVLGVLVAVACVQRLHVRGERLPFSVEVVGFADEEGLRFGTAFLGSSVYAGLFDGRLLDLEDGDGESLRDAVLNFGGDPEALARGAREASDFLGYCEVHIEQGPVLEDLGLQVGVVTSINGQSRVRAGFAGHAGHAGTVPMKMRKDALCAAAELVLEVEKAARSRPGAVGTVGEISAQPGAGNVIPGEAFVSLDLRHPEDEVRGRLRDHLEDQTRKIAAVRGCEPVWKAHQEIPAARMDPQLSGLLGRAVEEVVPAVHRLPSGAGHDAALMAARCPAALLFVRCERGISHHPAEAVAEEDVEVAIAVTARFLELLARDRA